MDKLTIICNGNVKEAFDENNGKFFDYLWENEFECTWSCIEEIDGENLKVTVFGFEPVEGMVQKFLDGRRKDNAAEALEDLGVRAVSIVHSLIKPSEYAEKKKAMSA